MATFSDVFPTLPDSPEPLPWYALRAYLPVLVITPPAPQVRKFAPKWERVQTLNCQPQHRRRTRKITVVNPGGPQAAARACTSPPSSPLTTLARADHRPR